MFVCWKWQCEHAINNNNHDNDNDNKGATGWLSGYLERWAGNTKGRGFESGQEHKKNLGVFPSQKGCTDSLSVCPTTVCVYEGIQKTM